MAKHAKPTALVTGAANGIGLGVSKALSDSGYRVHMFDRDEDQLTREAKSLGAEFCVGDVTSEADLIGAIARAKGEDDEIDLIVSNAGISEFASLENTTLDDWNSVLATNLTPAFLLAKHAETALRAASGRMVLIASTRAHMSEPDTHAYAATKGGLVALTHSLAISLGPDVLVNCISPGWINSSGEDLNEDDHAQHPAGRVGMPEDIAKAVLYFADAQNDFVTGAELVFYNDTARTEIYT